MADIANKDVRFIEGWTALLVKDGVIDEKEAANAVAWVAADPENWVTLNYPMGKDRKKVERGSTKCNASGLVYGSGDPRKRIVGVRS